MLNNITTELTNTIVDGKPRYILTAYGEIDGVRRALYPGALSYLIQTNRGIWPEFQAEWKTKKLNRVAYAYPACMDTDNEW